MTKSSRVVLATAVFCLLISGAAGLVYEVMWMRYLALFLGNTAYGVIAALVAFMGGLALGNAWLGRRADRVRRPLALYAWLEIGIGVYALIFPYYYGLCRQAFVSVAHHCEAGSAALLALKFLFSLLTILLPTVLMGGTLPVLIKLVTRSLGELRERVSTLYFINSAGAVAGCFIADFWWIPTLGLPASVMAGAGLNLLVGAVALFVSGWIREGSGEGQPAPVQAPAADEEVFSPLELRMAIIGIGLSGFVAMLYEVVWTRMLALALGSSTHAFSIMLITFISGVAVGAWIVGRWRKLRRTLDAFAWAELALAGTLLASMFFYDLLPYAFARLASMLDRRADVFPLYSLVQALICFAVMFIPTVCLGMTLPLVSRIATAELARTGRSVGAVFSVNTLGTVLGAAVTGLWILPWLGLAGTLALGVAVNAAIGFVILGRRSARIRAALILGTPVAAAALVMLAGSLFQGYWERAFTRALWRGAPLPSLAAFRGLVDRTKLDYYRDGAGSTVAVEVAGDVGRTHLTLSVNGKPDASTGLDATTQLLSGHIPMLLRPESKRVLVVGLGSGMTCGAVMRHPTVERLDAVEISPEVAQAARLFGPHNDQVLDNPKVRLVQEDAKTFLQLAEDKYDLIISEPSNPWMAGVAGVFSLEYYLSCRGRLQADGLMAQWVQVYETDDEAFQVVLRTFSSVFAHLSVWIASTGDVILVGGTQEPQIDLQAIRDRFELPGVKSDLERIDIFRLPVLLARQIISPDNAPFIAPWATPVHSDYAPVLESLAQRAFFAGGGATLQLALDENYSVRPATILARYLQKHPLTEDDYRAFSLFKLARLMPDERLYRSLLSRWLADFPQSTAALELSAKAKYHGVAEELEAQRLGARQSLIQTNAANDPELLRYYAHFLTRTYTQYRSVFYRPPAEELETALKQLVELDRANQRVYRLHLAELAWDRQDDGACLELAQKALSPDTNTFGAIQFDLDRPAPQRVLTKMIESYWRAGKPAEAWDLCQQAKAQGYLDSADAKQEPLLGIVYRKVEAFMNQSPEQRAR